MGSSHSKSSSSQNDTQSNDSSLVESFSKLDVSSTTPTNQPISSIQIVSEDISEEIQKEYKLFNSKSVPIQFNSKKWYNLETSRFLTNITTRQYLIYPRVVGTSHLIHHFLSINLIPMSDCIVNEMQTSLAKELQELSDNKESRSILDSNIDSISQDVLSELSPFSFIDVLVPGIITKVIDGDTVDAAMILDPKDLCYPRPIRDSSKTVIGYNCIDVPSSEDDPGNQLLLKFRIRLFKLDTAEKNTREGQSASKYAQELYSQNDNRVWLQLMGYDCRSRVLANIYPRLKDNSMGKISISDELLKYVDPVLGMIAKEYYGGSKTLAWDNKLPEKI